MGSKITGTASYIGQCKNM